MSSKKTIEISYIKEKVDKSPVITVEENMSIVDTKNQLSDIKDSIIGILECTNIHDKLEENTEWRHIYKIKEDITKHIYSVISTEYTKDDTKNIIREVLKTLTDNISSILMRWNNIYINDSWIKEKKIKVQNETKLEKRFNWYEWDELNILITDYIWDDNKVKAILKNILENINYKKLHLDQIISILTIWYKWYLLSEINKWIKTSFDIQNDISNAISGKILRDHFSYSNIILYEHLYNNLLENKLNSVTKTIESEIYKNIANKYLNFNKNNIYENLIKIKSIYNDEFYKVLNNKLNSIYIFEWTVNENAIKIIQMKIWLIFNKEIYKLIVESLINDLILVFKKNTTKLPIPVIDFLKQISQNYTEINVWYIKTPIDIIKLSSNLKLLINEEIKKESSIETKTKNIKEYRKKISSISKWIKWLELKYENNIVEINKQLIKIWFKSILNTELIISNLIEESKLSYDKEKELKLKLTKLSSNKLKETFNSWKIVNLKKQILKIKIKIDSLENIIKLIKENKKIKFEIEKYNETTKLISSSIQNIKKTNDELEIIKTKINQIKTWLINMFLKN